MKAIGTYRQSTVATADRMELVVMLYDGFLSFAHTASDALEAKDVGRSCEAVGQCLAIVHELVASLDPKASEQLVGSLFTLYEFVEYSLTEAKKSGNAKHMRDAIDIMVDLREAWSDASRQLRMKAA
ncbi:MAG: flagellar protein FliS [Bradymonadia bacterium]|jgi:flagellar protein FliS